MGRWHPGLNATFEQLYSRTGRPSIPPERLLRASLLQVLFSIRSERQLVQQIVVGPAKRTRARAGRLDVVFA